MAVGSRSNSNLYLSKQNTLLLLHTRRHIILVTLVRMLAGACIDYGTTYKPVLESILQGVRVSIVVTLHIGVHTSTRNVLTLVPWYLGTLVLHM